MNEDLLRQLQIELVELRTEFRNTRAEIAERQVAINQALVAMTQTLSAHAVAQATLAERIMSQAALSRAADARLEKLNGRSYSNSIRLAGYIGGITGPVALIIEAIRLYLSSK